MPPTDTEFFFATPQPSSLEETGTAAPSPVVVEDPPITNLPAELLLKIVQLGIDNALYDLPMTASQVCSRWRTLTLGSPLTWRTIRIYTLNTDDFARQLLRATTFAARSGSHAMTVYIDLPPPLVWEARGIVSSIAGFLSHHVERIRNLTIRYTPEFRDVGLPGMVSPALARRLKVYSMQGVPSDFFYGRSELNMPPTQVVISAFQCPDNQMGGRSPDIEELSLRATALVWSRFAPRRLRYLVLQDLASSTAPAWADLRHMLEANASTLADLDLSRVRPLGPRTEQPLKLPALRKLRIAYTNPSFLLDFSTSYRLPQLLELHLHDEAGRGAEARNRTQSDAFAYMMKFMPLQRLHYFHLSGMRFPRHSGEMMQTRVPLPIALFGQLRALTRLKLTKPDRRTMRALNTIMPLWCTEQGANANEPLLVPVVPSLVRLSLRHIRPNALKKFLTARAEIEGMCKLDVLDVQFRGQAPEVSQSWFVRDTVHTYIEIP